MWVLLTSSLEKNEVPVRIIDITFVSVPIKVSFEKEYEESVEMILPCAKGNIPNGLKYVITSKVYNFLKNKTPEKSEEEINDKMVAFKDGVYFFFVKYRNNFTNKEELFFSSLFVHKENCEEKIRNIQQLMNKIICSIPKFEM